MHRALSSYVLERTDDLKRVADRLIDILDGKLVITEQRIIYAYGPYETKDERGRKTTERGMHPEIWSVKVAPSHKDVVKAAEELRLMALGAPMKAEQMAAAHAKAELEAPASKAIEHLSEKQLTRVLDVLAELPADATPSEEGE